MCLEERTQPPTDNIKILMEDRKRAQDELNEVLTKQKVLRATHAVPDDEIVRTLLSSPRGVERYLAGQPRCADCLRERTAEGDHGYLHAEARAHGLDSIEEHVDV